MPEENPVRLTTWKVAQNSRDVKINQEKIERLAAQWAGQNPEIPAWPRKMHLETDDSRKMLDYLIILDSLNFCFWPRAKSGEKWKITYGDKAYDGYFALSLALKKFFEENSQKANLGYFANMPFSEFSAMFGAGRNLQFLKKRWEITRKVSGFLAENYQTSELFICSAGNKPSALVPKIANELYSFNDIAYGEETKEYHWKHPGISAVSRKETIFFWKRAQILAIDIWASVCDDKIGYFEDLDYVTAFADYKLPQILRHWNILEYSPELENKIRNQIIIPAGSREEIEVRSATIWAVEFLCAAMVQRGKKMHAFEIDWLLWNKSQSEKMVLPHHRTETIFY